MPAAAIVGLSVFLSRSVLFLLLTFTTIPSTNSSNLMTKGIAAIAAVHWRVCRSSVRKENLDRAKMWAHALLILYVVTYR